MMMMLVLLMVVVVFLVFLGFGRNDRQSSRQVISKLE